MNANPSMTQLGSSNPRVGLSFEEASNRVNSLDLNEVAALVKQHHNDWSDARLSSAVQWYRRFLVMNAMYQGQMIISTQDVDDVWHAHVLHSKLYFQDCAKVFGFYLHHHPVVRDGREDLKPYQLAFKDTLKLSHNLFGELPPMDRVVQLNPNDLDQCQMVCSGNGDCSPGIGIDLKLDANGQVSLAA